MSGYMSVRREVTEPNHYTLSRKPLFRLSYLTSQYLHTTYFRATFTSAVFSSAVLDSSTLKVKGKEKINSYEMAPRTLASRGPTMYT